MASRFDLDVTKIANGDPAGLGAKWEVRIGGKIRGIIERATISFSGQPEYLAHYLVGLDRVTHSKAFPGEDGHLKALCLISKRYEG